MTAATATSTRRVSLVDVVVLTATSIVPLLFGADGRLNADTKQYLYLDPGGLMRRAFTLWDRCCRRHGVASAEGLRVGWGRSMAMDVVGLPDRAAQRL